MSCILISCACNKRIEEKNLKLFKMNYTSCTKEASAAAACEQRRYSTPKYTTAASDSSTVTTQIGWDPGPSFCIRSWHMKVGDKVKLKETYYGDSDIVIKAVVENSSESDRVERHEVGLDYVSMAAMIQARGGLGRRDVDEVWPGKYDADDADSSGSSEAASVAGPSGINASGAASVEVTGTGLVNGRPVINRLFIEQLFNSSDDSDDEFWTPDEGFHEVCIEGKNNKDFKHECTLIFSS
jgi:hypothetical protein